MYNIRTKRKQNGNGERKMARKRKELTFDENEEKITEESLTWEDVNAIPEELDERYFVQDVDVL